VSQLLETVGPRSGSAPLAYTLAEQGTVDLQAVFAHFDGAAASGAWRPTLTIKSQNGTILARLFPSDTLAVGDTADVTYAPFLSGAGGAAGGSLATTDGTTTIDPTDTLRIGGGLVLTNPASGEAALATELAGGLFEPFVSGQYVSQQIASTGGATQGASSLNAAAFWVPTDSTFDRIGVILNGATDVNRLTRLGIYTNLLGYPDALVLDAGTVTGAGGGNRLAEIAISQALTRGIYWLATVNQGVGNNSCVGCDAANGSGLNVIFQAATALDWVTGGNGFLPRLAGVAGALPNPWTGRLFANTASVNRVLLRVA
jgi:hypothetical protein